MRKTQMQIYREVESRRQNVVRTFVDMQRGPNPLTNADIESLIANEERRRPNSVPIWDQFRGKGIETNEGGE